jgi:regulator of protease activity HflC (stomatin/prohibitin superfamily)
MTVLQIGFDYLIELAWAHPIWTIATLVAFVRLWGTVIQTGWTGVLFVFGRARQTLAPGFHFLLPLVHFVRKTPVRSITLDLPKQRVTSADGLVYDVDASVVYRVDDAIVALTHVHNLHRGALVVLTMAVQEVIGLHTRQALQERRALDEAFAIWAQEKLSPWGVKVEQAGFTTVAPTKKTLRLTQLRHLVEERQRMLDEYRCHGLSPELALVLLGSHRQLIGHAQARYRRQHRKRGDRRAAVVQIVPLLVAFRRAGDSDAAHETVVYESIAEQALCGRPVDLQVGEQVRWSMSGRRRIDKIVVQKGGLVQVQPVRGDGTMVEITALKEGEAVILLRNDRAGAETIRVRVTTDSG